jgi:chromosome segregation ATPase
MSDIEQLQGRIMAAMERAARGLEKLAPAKEDVPDLSQDLEEERLANAQLTERVKSLNDQLEAATAEAQAKLDAADAKVAELEAKLAQEGEAQSRVEQLDVELQQVRGANTKLSEACAALRAANEEGVGDADLINQAMQAELDALRAARTAQIAEAEAILSALSPLVEAAQEYA